VGADALSTYWRHNTDPENPKSAFFHPESVRVRVIVVPKLATAQKAMRELTMGISFETVARHYSQDTSAPNGGLLPPIGIGRTPLRHVPGMETLLFGMHPGQLAGPVQFLGAWFVIRCEEHAQAYTAPFDSVKTLARQAVLLKKGLKDTGAREMDEFEKFRKKSNIIVLRNP
jgi:parvulin-like peptidyl-prolyl isomerase